MKKIFALILGITLAYSCSTSSDGNGNSTTTVVPIAPSNLTGVVASPTQINLSWTDNSTNETGFKIERKTGTGNYAIVGTTSDDITTFSNTGLTPSTSYTYRVYSNNSVGNSLTYSNELNLTTTSLINLPTLTTGALSLITSSSAVSGGTISSDGGASITARGVCWSTSANPTIALSTKTNNGSGIGTFVSNLSSLALNVTYYIRSYASNIVGTGYGNEISFTTRYAIGDIGPAGGFIFYDKGVSSNGWRYLEASPSDYNTGIAWWNGTWVYTNTTGISPNTSLGAGKANTLLIISANNNLSNAAKVCDNYSYNGFSDWYLPSSEELQLICQNLYSSGIGNLQPNFYWSSTDTNRIHNATWMQLNGCYVRTDGGRDMLNLVRPIRQF